MADELNLTCSVGVGRSKLMAKLASKAAKPIADREGIAPGAGVVVVPPDGELEFLHPLPVRALWGVGPVTGRRLEALGINTVGDIAALGPGVLERYLGASQGAHLAELSRGHDPRPVVPEQAAKSIGHEETFGTDIWDLAELHEHLVRMVDASATALRRAQLAARTVNIKVKFADFTLLTRSHTMQTPIDASPAVAAVAGALLDTVDLKMGVRLLGVSLSGFGRQETGTQLSLDLGSFGSDPEAAASDPDRPPPPRPPNCWTGPTRRPSGSSTRGERSRPPWMRYGLATAGRRSGLRPWWGRMDCVSASGGRPSGARPPPRHPLRVKNDEPPCNMVGGAWSTDGVWSRRRRPLTLVAAVARCFRVGVARG